MFNINSFVTNLKKAFLSPFYVKNVAFKLLMITSTVNIQMVNKVTKMTVYLTRKVEEVKNPSNSVAVAALFRTIHQKLDGLFTNE